MIDGALRAALAEAGVDPGLMRVFVAYVEGEARPAIQFDEAEVTRRLRVLSAAAAGDPGYEETVAEVREYHNQRRAAGWAKGDGDGG